MCTCGRWVYVCVCVYSCCALVLCVSECIFRGAVENELKNVYDSTAWFSAHCKAGENPWPKEFRTCPQNAFASMMLSSWPTPSLKECGNVCGEVFTIPQCALQQIDFVLMSAADPKKQIENCPSRLAKKKLGAINGIWIKKTIRKMWRSQVEMP